MANNNTQMRRVIRRNDQRNKLDKAYTDVCLALDAVSDTMACSGSEVVASWLSPAHIRLCRAKAALSELLREGGTI